MAAMLCTNHSWPFEKAYTPIYQTFRMFSLHIDAPSHTFSYGGLQCLSESRGGSQETKSIFRICARRYYMLKASLKSVRHLPIVYCVLSQIASKQLNAIISIRVSYPRD